MDLLGRLDSKFNAKKALDNLRVRITPYTSRISNHMEARVFSRLIEGSKKLFIYMSKLRPNINNKVPPSCK